MMLVKHGSVLGGMPSCMPLVYMLVCSAVPAHQPLYNLQESVEVCRTLSGSRTLLVTKQPVESFIHVLSRCCCSCCCTQPQPPPSPKVNSTVLYISNLHWWTTDAAVETAAAAFGPVVACRCVLVRAPVGGCMECWP
jgi:hypothetical protein